MYTTNPDQLRQGLVNYIGAMVESSPLTGNKARHAISAVLVEEALKMATTDDDFDFFVAKPILRGAVYSLDKRIEALLLLPENDEVKVAIKSYRTIVSRLNNLLDSLK